ncbi:MAG TPA: 16S rRNA (adenine(1518)-N(6)/adenine(1519)-N(6))-dimethyltransferase RsmA [Pontiellaceae bacterium]|nr:16S rRNA (adenine(1518)-N(6)/adenine(1519)-N(6))-dimethyltransferase RsmA [Pontiellaceae bacterium]HPR83164.1 16S rRNA (adenine(1518)-N(6)/adenine(1519)-N(6))-dimethyltransferase RsmA [Pontiellaceae bacterium]
MNTPGKLTSPSIIRALLDSLGHRPNKGLGQNYLIDSNILGIIIEAANVSPSDQLLEIGPGLGALTQALMATGATLTAIEKDQTMSAHLRTHFPQLPLIDADVLDVNLSELFAGGINKIVANLPYSVGSRFIVNALEARPLPERMVFMVQKEVADRLTAQPGGKDYGPLAIWSQLNYEVKTIKNVSPTCFMPAPKVWSAVVRFEKRTVPLAEVKDYEQFKKLIKLSFTQRRKQIGSNLRKNYPEFFPGLETCGIDPATRPEQISVKQWVALANAADSI